MALFDNQVSKTRWSGFLYSPRYGGGAGRNVTQPRTKIKSHLDSQTLAMKHGHCECELNTWREVALCAKGFKDFAIRKNVKHLKRILENIINFFGGIDLKTIAA